MTTERRPEAARTQRSAVYEFRVAGPIGAVVRSALREFTATLVPACTVLSGTFGDPDDLQRLLDALHADGLPVSGHLVTHRE